MRLKFITLVSLLFIALFASGQITSQYGKGMKYVAPDESFSLKFGLRIQPLFTTNFRDFEKLDQPELNEIQMMIRRARLKFDGHVYNKRWVYKFELAFGNRNIGGISEFTNMGARVILDAVIKYQATKNFYIWFGQTKLPGNRERVVSSQKLQFVDRHLVNSRFNLDRDMGFQIRGKHMLGEMPINTAFALSMGEGRNITEVNLGGLEYTLRGEILPLGKFTSKGDYFEADLVREPKPKLSIGVTFDYNDRAARTRSNQGNWLIQYPDSDNPVAYTNSLTTWWVDAHFKYNGWSFLAEGAYRTSENSAIAIDTSGNHVGTYYVGSGLNLQGGYVFKRNWEVAGRVTWLRPEELVTNEANQYTLVVSKYIAGHNLKIQSDISYTEYKAFNGSEKSDPLMFRFQVELAL